MIRKVYSPVVMVRVCFLFRIVLCAGSLLFRIVLVPARCQDIRDHPILGRTYRVDVEYQSKERTTQEVREQVVRSIATQKEKGNSAKAKGKAKAKAAARAQPSGANRKMIGDATRVLAKVSPALFSVRQAHRKAASSALPDQYKNKLQDCPIGRSPGMGLPDVCLFRVFFVVPGDFSIRINVFCLLFRFGFGLAPGDFDSRSGLIWMCVLPHLGGWVGGGGVPLPCFQRSIWTSSLCWRRPHSRQSPRQRSSSLA